tara:strand:+ start:574 stop:885 length:312 start_codon:yes stop_codon:yes gene_type:complete
MKKYTSWNTISSNKLIEFIEDPILNMELFKSDFEETYKDILETLTAEKGYLDTTVEYYFELHPLRKNVLVFRNDEKKNEFYDIGIELECIVPLKKIQEGTQND